MLNRCGAGDSQVSSVNTFLCTHHFVIIFTHEFQQHEALLSRLTAIEESLKFDRAEREALGKEMVRLRHDLTDLSTSIGESLRLMQTELETQKRRKEKVMLLEISGHLICVFPIALPRFNIAGNVIPITCVALKL